MTYTHDSAEPENWTDNLTVRRTQDGSYTWVIVVPVNNGTIEDFDQAIEVARHVDTRLLDTFIPGRKVGPRYRRDSA
jgi:hypothetical protein